MPDNATENVIRFSMKLLTGNSQPYQLGYQLDRLGDGISKIIYPIISDAVSGMIFYVGRRDLNPEIASAVMSQPNASYDGTVTVTIDRATGRRTLSIQNAANTEFGRGVLEQTEARYNALYTGAAEPADYAPVR